MSFKNLRGVGLKENLRDGTLTPRPLGHIIINYPVQLGSNNGLRFLF
jgi:hypothetical protein